MEVGRRHAIVAGLAMVCVVGIGGGCSNRGDVVEAPELGLSMPAPAGWAVDRSDPRLCSRGLGTGIVLDEPLRGGAFSRHVDDVLDDFGGRIRSRADRRVSGRQAIEAVVEYPAQGSTALKLFVDGDGTVVEISFVTPSDEFADQEAALRAALADLRVD